MVADLRDVAGNILLTLVIPAFNESKRIDALFWKLLDFQSHWKRRYSPQSLQVLIVVEPSQDKTLEIARSKSELHPWIRVIGNPVHYGKGYAVRTGIMKAEGQYIAISDADLSTPLDTLFSALESLQKDSELDWIAGERKSDVNRKSFLRSIGSRVYRKVRNFILRQDLTDTQCGFKIFKSHAGKILFKDLETLKFAYDIEIFCRSKLNNLKFSFMPVEWFDQPHSTVKFFRDGLRMLVDTLRIAQKFRSGEWSQSTLSAENKKSEAA